MDIGLRAIAATILLWAAAAKLARGRDAASALASNGVPRAAQRPAVVALVVVEGALGVLLLVGPNPRLVGLGVAGLGAVFAVVLSTLWVRGGRRVTCACFGRARERPTALLVARALVLVALGIAIAIGVPTPSSGALVVGALAVLSLAVAALAALVLALYRQVGVLYQRLGPGIALEIAEEGPPVGAPAPDLGGLQRHGAELVAFGSSGCRLCVELAPALSALERTGLSVRAVSEDAEPAAFDRWGVPGTPFVAFLVDGMVRAKGLVNTMEQLESVIESGTERGRHAVS